MVTVKLYYQDTYLREFSARVLACETWKGVFRVALDRTAFYPEGGGQPADHGTLTPVGVVRLGQNAETDKILVTDVHERDGVVWHTVLRPLELGAYVVGSIDWNRRFDHMQQHSGEHILSGILCRQYNCDNVGFHLGAETVTIDYNTSISWEEAAAAERAANAVIQADRAVEITWPSSADLAELDYRSKKELTGAVRIVTFPEADCCACCGTHVTRAGQVGLVKILSCQKFREGVRLEILCGNRAVSYLSAVWEQARAVGQRLSVKPDAILGAVERLETDLDIVKARTAALEEELFQAIARERAGVGNVLLFRETMRPDSVRRLADAVARQCGGLAAVFSGSDGQGFAYALVRYADDVNPNGSGCEDSSKTAELGIDVKTMNEALNGRGGGRGGFAQGSVRADRKAIQGWFQTRLYNSNKYL